MLLKHGHLNIKDPLNLPYYCVNDINNISRGKFGVVSMTCNDISYIRQLFEIEKNKIARLNTLLNIEDEKEYLEIKGLKEEFYTFNEWDIIAKILEEYTVDKTNGIYVCIGAYYTDCSNKFKNCSTTSCSFDDPLLEYRTYRDIETGQFIRAFSSEEFAPHSGRKKAPLINSFENNFVVLNPCNTNVDHNGFNKVRKEFFTIAISSSEEEAKEYILNKYPRMIPYIND